MIVPALAAFAATASVAVAFVSSDQYRRRDLIPTYCLAWCITAVFAFAALYVAVELKELRP